MTMNQSPSMDEALEQEIEALQAIYDPDQVDVSRPVGGSISSQSSSSPAKIASITFKFNAAIYLLVEIFAGYPNTSPRAEMIMNKRIPAKSTLDSLIESTLADNRGHECIFQLIEALKEFLEVQGLLQQLDSGHLGEDQELTTIHGETGKALPSDGATSSSNGGTAKPGTIEQVEHLRIIHGEITKERKSTFQSHLCAVQSMADVELFRYAVLTDKRVAQATHNIAAYRFTGQSVGHGGAEHGTANISFHDYDSDGETAAGGKLAEMMRLMGVDGVAVIVSRWFGGILLGPDRFKFICNSARKILEENGYGPQQVADSKSTHTQGNIHTSSVTHKKKN